MIVDGCDLPVSTRGGKIDLALAVKALEDDDPNSALALSARWRIRSILAMEKVSSTGRSPMERAILDNTSKVYAECSVELEKILEERGY